MSHRPQRKGVVKVRGAKGGGISKKKGKATVPVMPWKLRENPGLAGQKK